MRTYNVMMSVVALVEADSPEAAVNTLAGRVRDLPDTETVAGLDVYAGGQKPSAFISED